MKTLTRITCLLLGIVILTLAAATAAEHRCGSAAVAQYVYGAWWFVALWGALFGCGMTLCIVRALYRRRPAFLLHCAFGVILAGALLTFATARRGNIHLRIGAPPAAQTIDLPFALELKDFDLRCYPGTDSPADYVSRVAVIRGETSYEATISMNNILRESGYRLSQASFDDDLRGTVLAVNYDPWGTPVTYAGYLLLAVAMGWILLDRKGRYRALLRSLALAGVLLDCALPAAAQRTVPRETAERMGRLPVLYNDRIAPLDTYARDFTIKLCGKPAYKEFTAMQVLLGWYFYSDDWRQEPMIRVKEPAVRQILGTRERRLRYDDFFTSDGAYRLLTRWRDAARQESVDRVNERIQLAVMAESGTAFRLFPGAGGWFSPADYLYGVPADDRLFISGVFDLLYEALEQGDTAAADRLVDKIAVWQRQHCEALPAPRKIDAELLYNRLHGHTWLYRLNLLVGFLALGIALRRFLRGGAPNRTVDRLLGAALFVSTSVLTLTLLLRGYVAGHLPMSNGYETMMVLAECVLIITLAVRRRFAFALPVGLLLSGLILLVASLGAMNPRITPLMPVLASPWLSLHVSLIMIAYTFFALLMLNSCAGLLLRRRTETAERLQRLGETMLYPALFLLTAGIFVGAVWANVSWGRYWGWDPKEVWALITMLLYAVPLHRESLPIFRRPAVFHLYCFVAFCAVLMTYFGVNYLLGGLHSYAG